MNNIIYDDEIITPKGDIWEYYYSFLTKLEQRDCVKFALFCAKYVNPNTKESNVCIELVEKWLKDENSVSKQKLWDAAFSAYYSNFSYTAYSAYAAAYAAYADAVMAAANATTYSAWYAVAAVNIDIINKYLQILLRKTKQFQNNQVLEQISKTDVDRLELVDWNMITDIMQEEYNIVHEFSYEDIFSRRCLIELLRREYT